MASLHHQNRGSRDAAAGKRRKGLVRLVQAERRGRDADGSASRRREQLSSVGASVGGHARDRSLSEEVTIVVEGRDLAKMHTRERQRCSPIHLLQRYGDEASGGSKNYCGIERGGHSFGRVAGRRGAELKGKPARPLRPRDDVDGRPLADRDLTRDVSGAAEPIDPEPAPGREPRPPQRAVTDDASTQERRRVLVVEKVGKRIRVVLSCKRVLGVSAVLIPSGKARVRAEVLVSANAEPASAARLAEPCDADAVADRKALGAGPEGFYDADDLMSGNDALPMYRQVALGDVEVRPAHGTRARADAHLSVAGLRHVDVRKLNWPCVHRPRSRHLPRLHTASVGSNARVRFDAVVLAGGRARRLGGIDKTMIEIGDTTLLERVLNSVTDASTVVVVGPRQTTRVSAVWTRERPRGAGPVHALRAGLTYVTAPLVAVMAADLPFVSREVTQRLIVAARDRDGAIVIDDDGRDQMMLGMYATEALRARLSRIANTVGASMGELIDGLDLQRVADAAAAFDCDTDDDVAAARQKVGDLSVGSMDERRLWGTRP
jgi:molybdopterin-guanine dinucleotide biosynthesis protein A